MTTKAIIDLGTRAARILISNPEHFYRDGFNFSNFDNRAELIELGNFLTPVCNGYEMKIQGLGRAITFLNKSVERCMNLGIEPENIHCVATEVFRRSQNLEQVLEIITNTTGVAVNVLTPEEEAETSFVAASYSMEHLSVDSSPYLVIEVGGGSAQITVGNMADGELQVLKRCSIPELGSLLMRRRFLGYTYDSNDASLLRIKTVQKEVQEYASNMIQKHLRKEFNNSLIKQVSRAAALGKVMTSLASGSNKHMHGKRITMDKMKNYSTKSDILSRYKNYAVRSLLKDAHNGTIQENIKTISNELDMALGLPVYTEILTFFGLGEVRICGAGLRYGIFFRDCLNDWPQ